jgi:hypothetical protein
MRRYGALCAVLLVSSVSQAQVPWTQAFVCPSPVPPAGCGGAASAPANDLMFNSTSPSLYIAQNSSIYALRTDGTSRWTHTFPASVQNFPSPVMLRNGSLAIFVGGVDGFLYKLDATTGNVLWSKDLRRSTCLTGDQIIATPTVQLKQYSTGFTPVDDVVYVITSYGCSTTTQNRVWAINASDGSFAWKNGATAYQFNDGALGGTYSMDFGSEGCALDYGRNLLYCGTNLTAGKSQPTLWAISTNNGALAWSANVGSVRSRPALKNNSNLLYVANYSGTLLARDAANLGAAIYSVGLTTTANVTRSPWPEFRGSYANMILVADMGGNVYAVQHSPASGGVPASGAKVWTATPSSMGGSGGASTMPVVEPGSGKVYVGLTDGTLHQLAISTGNNEDSFVIDSTQLYDPSLDTDGVQTAGLDRLTVSGGSNVARYPIPWNIGMGHTGCNKPACCNYGTCDGLTCFSWQPLGTDCSDACHTGTCGTNAFGQEVCNQVQKPNGTACTYNSGVPAVDQCNTGTCMNGNCTAVPKTDGTACPGDTSCHAGACQTGKCTYSPMPDGTACNDFQACTCDAAYASGNPLTCPSTCSNPSGCDTCQGGRCWGSVATTCMCVNDGDHACAPGVSCCGANAGGCVNVNTSYQSCGYCGAQCPTNQHCAGGQCAAGCDSTSCGPHGTCQGNGTCCGSLAPGQTLAAGQSMGQCGTSCGVTMTLFMQGDGNLVLYQGGTALWSSGTAGNSGAYALMGGDGNLQVIRGSTVLWSTGTSGYPGSDLAIQGDGNLVIYNSACTGVNNSCWYSGSHYITNCAGKNCGSDGCGGSCGTCGGTTPTCNASQVCVCSGSSCSSLGSQYSCNGSSCVCTPNCAGKNCGSDGCGGSCGSCGGTTPVCNPSGVCVCTTSACQAGIGPRATCNAGTGQCQCSGLCPTSSQSCDDTGGNNLDGCGNACPINCATCCLTPTKCGSPLACGTGCPTCSQGPWPHPDRFGY